MEVENVEIEKRGGIFGGYWTARCDTTGMVAYDKRKERALIRLVQMHALAIESLKSRLKEE